MRNNKFLPSFLVVILLISLLAGCSGNNSNSNSNPGTEAPSNPQTTDNDNYEEGTSDTDGIVNTTAADKVILVVSFGTSFNQSRNLTIGGIETAIADAYPDYQVRRAFTSQIIIDKLSERNELKIDNVTEAMDRLVLDKVKEVVIQPTHVMTGFEYDDVIAEVMPYADKFESFKIGKPLLVDDSDYDEVSQLIVDATSSYRNDDTAFVFMGHGTEHDAGSTYNKLQDTLTDKGYTNYVIGTVEHGIEIDEVVEILSGMDVKKVVLRPLMVVSGDHANNDMAGGEEDSWDFILEEEGYEVITVLEGLGQIEGIQQLYIKHIKEAISSDSLSKTSAAPTAGVSANRIKDGTYQIEVSSSTSMFRIVDCQLTVEGDSMSAVITLSGKGFGKIYMGTGEEALADTEYHFYNYTDNGEQHFFTVPVSALDREMDCAGLSIRKDTWYDHIVVFKSDSIPDDAFLPTEISVDMTGGTGRTSIESPATLLYRDGKDYARIIWSSPNYIYMLVDGVEYLPINIDGNSTFEIPVKLDQNMQVIACTVAMSEPKEIEYILHFDASTIK